MDWLLCVLARMLVGVIQAMPLTWVARGGRAGGALFWLIDARHRRVAIRNLTQCFGGERSPEDLHALARENFRRVGENFACAIRTAAMSFEELRAHVELVGAERFLPKPGESRPLRCVVAVGHFGNFELYARFAQFEPKFVCATTYRGLRQPRLNRLLQSLRERSGCRFFERRTEAAALKAALNREPNMMLGLLADQHAGQNGLALPFLGHLCSTSAAPAVFALRYNCPLFTACCFRTGIARWRMEVGDEIPTHEAGQVRSVEAIALDMNRAFEVAVRRDPANWFWVHNRWKPERMNRHGAKVGTDPSPPDSPPPSPT